MKKNNAFTLIELLTVMAIMAILGTILVAGISKVRSRALGVRSINNLRQLHAGTLLFTQENRNWIPAGREGDENLINPRTTSGQGALDYWMWQTILHPYVTTQTILPTSNLTPDSGTGWFGIDKSFVDPVYSQTESYEERPWVQGYGINRYMRLPKGRHKNSSSHTLRTGIFLTQIEFPEETILFATDDNWSWAGGRRSRFAPDSEPATRYNGKGHYVFIDGRVASLEPQEVMAFLAP